MLFNTCDSAYGSSMQSAMPSRAELSQSIKKPEGSSSGFEFMVRDARFELAAPTVSR